MVPGFTGKNLLTFSVYYENILLMGQILDLSGNFKARQSANERARKIKDGAKKLMEYRDKEKASLTVAACDVLSGRLSGQPEAALKRIELRNVLRAAAAAKHLQNGDVGTAARILTGELKHF